MQFPLFIEMWVKKKRRYTIALNQYRNWMYIVSNNVKKEYKKLVEKQTEGWEKLNTPIKITFTYYNPTKRKSDLENFCTIHNKFLQDALVELWLLEDDNYEYVTNIEYVYWGYKAKDGRVEVEIKQNN